MDLKSFTYSVTIPDVEQTLQMALQHLLNQQPHRAQEVIQRYLSAKEAQRHVDKALIAFIEAVKRS